MLPKVSIVTPSFNQGRFIEETILSVLSQDYPNLEYWVVDGASTDETLDVLRRYEGRLAWISEPDGGQSEAINKGFQRATGEILAWLNSDDVFLPGAIHKAVSFLEANPDVMMVYGEGYLMDEAGIVTRRFPFTEPFNLWRLVHFGDYILQQTVFMRKRIFDEIGMLDESLHYGMDWDLWIRIGKRFKIAYMPEYLGSLREYGEAKSFSGGIKRFKELAAIVRCHGMRRYPPALLNYGWQPYQDAILKVLRRRYPWMGWDWLDKLAETFRQITAYTLFKKLTSLSYPSPFADGWVSDRAYFLLPFKEGQEKLVIRGSTQHNPDSALPLKLKVKINGRSLQVQRLDHRVCCFELSFPLPTEMPREGMLEVILSTNKYFIPAHFGSSDSRCLAFQLNEITLA